MVTNDDLKYLFDLYLNSINRGKQAPRAAKNLILALEANEIYLHMKNIK